MIVKTTHWQHKKILADELPFQTEDIKAARSVKSSRPTPDWMKEETTCSVTMHDTVTTVTVKDLWAWDEGCEKERRVWRERVKREAALMLQVAEVISDAIYFNILPLRPVGAAKRNRPNSGPPVAPWPKNCGIQYCGVQERQSNVEASRSRLHCRAELQKNSAKA